MCRSLIIILLFVYDSRFIVYHFIPSDDDYGFSSSRGVSPAPSPVRDSTAAAAAAAASAAAAPRPITPGEDVARSPHTPLQLSVSERLLSFVARLLANNFAQCPPGLLGTHSTLS